MLHIMEQIRMLKNSLLAVMIIGFIADPARSCTWSDMSFTGGKVKAVNSMAIISVWNTGDKYSESQYVITWQKDNKPISQGRYEKNETISLVNGFASFKYNGTFMSSTLSILLNAYDDSKNLSINDQRCKSSRDKSFVMSVKYCNETEKRLAYDQNKTTVQINSTFEKPVFRATGECSCSHGDLYHVSGIRANGSVSCNDIAQWDGCDDVQCWFAPTIDSISQGSNYSGEPANFSCLHDDGFPNKTDLVFFISNQTVSLNKILNSSDHNKQYRCEANNNFTRDNNKSAASSPINLVVFFSPEIKPTEGQKFIKFNDSEEVDFEFQANRNSGNITATFVRPNGSETVKAVDIQSDDVNYNTSYTIAINSPMDYGNYSFTVRTYDPDGSDIVSIDIVNQPVTTPVPPTTTTTDINSNEKTLYIAVGCSVAVVLIIVLVVFLIVYRKRKEKSASDDDIKEERENPLYGSAPGPSINAEYATVDKSKKKQEKEEKVNPIYQGTSAGADADTVEEAYAAIDIKKKKKKEKNSEGSENSAFDPEATYAAVNKPKKKKNAEPPPDVVYSAVQKKKKNDQPSDTDLHV